MLTRDQVERLMELLGADATEQDAKTMADELQRRGHEPEHFDVIDDTEWQDALRVAFP